MIRPQMFSGELWTAPPGEVVFESAGKSDSQTVFGWLVPVGVYEVCMLGISSHRAYATRISRAGADLLNTTWTLGSNGTFGGNGGDAGPDTGGPYRGGGGAGGYSGDGGIGWRSERDAYGYVQYFEGTRGKGGGGNGGYVDERGGSVGIYGQGVDSALLAGAGGLRYDPSPSASESGVPKPGGNLRYRNAVAVAPGETLTVTLDHWVRDNSVGLGAVVRILWGPGRSFPNNAAKAT